MASYSLLTVLSVLTAISAQRHAIITALQNPFDGGEVGSCQVPAVTECQGLVDYPVPTSIAKLANIIETSIRNELVDRDEGCANAYREVLCTLRFPRCLQLQEGTEDRYLEVQLNNQDCSVLRSACPGKVGPALEAACNSLSQTTVPSTGCRPVSELVGDFTFDYCNLDTENTLVTDWMFELIKFADQRSGGILYKDVHCGENLATFMCNFHGKCVENQSRIEFINTQEHCNEVQSCYGDDHEMFAADELSCPNWAQAHLRDLPRVTSSSSPPIDTVSVGTLHSTESTQGNTGLNTDFIVNSGHTLRQCVLPLTVALFIAFLFVFVSL